MHLCDGGRQASAYVRPLSDGGMKLPLGQQVIAEVYLNGKWNSRQVQLTPVEMRRWPQAAVERWVGG